MFDRMIQELRLQINDRPKLKTGEEFYLDFDPDTSICIKLYARPPKNIAENEKYANAIYDSDNYCIEVFLNNLLRKISVKNPLDYIKKHFPEELVGVLRHELSHAYEDMVSGVYTHTSPVDTRDTTNYANYFNSETEINAYFQQHIPTIISKNPLIQHFIRKGDIKSATRTTIKAISQHPDFAEFFNKNKEWFYKTIYTTLDHLIAK